MTTLPIATTAERSELSAVPRPRRITADRSHLADRHRPTRPVVPVQVSAAGDRSLSWLFVAPSGHRTRLVMSRRAA
jgi:hypothetical protein